MKLRKTTPLTEADAKTLQGILQETVQKTAEASKKPFLADRVMRQIATPIRSDSLLEDIEFFHAFLAMFRPVALSGFVLLLVMILYTVQHQETGSEVAYTADEMLYMLPESRAGEFELEMEDLEAEMP